MKKLALGLSLAAAMGFAVTAQAASTGTITFEGELTATSCDVNVDGQGSDATITLPTMGINQLDAAGKTAGRTNFVMDLTNCAGTLKTVAAYFEAGASVDPVTGRLKNAAGADNATKVSLQLRDGSSTSYDVIKAGDASQSTKTTFVTYDATEGTATLPYAVEYYAEDATTAGKVNSSVVYSLMYK
ncbi:type 1 fimbrial protein [Cronobacter sakazakii]|uniref:fimbrial protein n=1 Tax=Cronobacter sakazakii TaxID=28141 RepID=UPI00158801ED|nr:fimbrial protein [Cronobacter sakazakii]NUW65035.1 type 1 fimbrial protein [Cronobacter sakazakii]